MICSVALQQQVDPLVLVVSILVASEPRLNSQLSKKLLALVSVMTLNNLLKKEATGPTLSAVMILLMSHSL